MEQIIVDVKNVAFDARKMYVAFSRGKTLQGLFIKNFKHANIKVSSSIVKWKDCPRSEPVPKVLSLPREEWIKISHPNMHSYFAKHEYIITDQAMAQANIMCFH